MRLFEKLATFRRLSVAERLLVAEAVASLAVARMVILTVPFRRLAVWLSRSVPPRTGDKELIVRVRRSVGMAASNVPWNAVCLPQAMAAKAMLARRGCGSTFHLGAATGADGKLIAHAWLAVGETIVVGAAGVSAVVPLARFG
jgi:hypothetical protein